MAREPFESRHRELLERKFELERQLFEARLAGMLAVLLAAVEAIWIIWGRD